MAQAYVYEDDVNGWRTMLATDLPASGVTAGTYGDASHVSQVTVNAEGLVTAASNVAVSGGPPSGAAGGDLGSTYPDPTVVAVEETGGPTRLALGSIPDGDFLKRSGSSIVGAAGGGTGTISDISSTGGTITVGSPTGPTTNVDLAATAVSAGSYGDSGHVGTFTVDADGRLTAASSVSISGGGSVVASDGWVPDSNSYTYASATSFTVGASDLTAVYSTGTRIKLTQTTVKYFVVVDSTFGAGTTTVTVTGGSDYSLANAAITSPFYSYVGNPLGYPGVFNFTCNSTGFSSLTSDVGVFSIVGHELSLLTFIVGTSNASTFTWTAPAPVKITGPAWGAACWVTDAGLGANGRGVILASATTVTMGKTITAAGGFTSSGSKGLAGTAPFIYPI